MAAQKGAPAELIGAMLAVDAEAAAAKDIRGMLPLDLAVRHKAAPEVLDLLRKATRDVAIEVKDWEASGRLGLATPEACAAAAGGEGRARPRPAGAAAAGQDSAGDGLPGTPGPWLRRQVFTERGWACRRRGRPRPAEPALDTRSSRYQQRLRVQMRKALHDLDP